MIISVDHHGIIMDSWDIFSIAFNLPLASGSLTLCELERSTTIFKNGKSFINGPFSSSQSVNLL